MVDFQMIGKHGHKFTCMYGAIESHVGWRRTKKNSERLPVYSGKQIVNGLLRIFSSKRSFLFKNRIIDVSVNHLLLQIESNNLRDSCIRFCEQMNGNKHMKIYMCYNKSYQIYLIISVV